MKIKSISGVFDSNTQMLIGEPDRYAPLIALPQIGWRSREKLASACVAIVGCGGLGTVSASLLAQVGIGCLRLVDDDRVEQTNLVGQTLFDEDDARTGQFKVMAVANRLGCLNPAIKIEPVRARLNNRNADQLIAGAGLVLDGTDNDFTRFLINRACLKRGIPWVFAAVLESYGLIMNVMPGETPCFVCVFGVPRRTSHRNSKKGYLASATHVVASLQVSQALRLLVGNDGYQRGLVYVDTWEPSLERLEIKLSLEKCPICGR